MQFRKSDVDLQKDFDETVEPRIVRTEVLGRELRYLEAGKPTGTLYFFIHGAPGSLDDFLEYLVDPELQQRGRLVGFDRPGYGYSGFGEAEPSMEEHARIAVGLLEQIRQDDRVVVVGHSYGGTVALQMASGYPGLADRYLLLAASASAEDERIFWFNRPASWLLVRWALPRAWRVANVEKMSQVENLRALEPKLGSIREPTLVIHGNKDRIVPVEHGHFLREKTTDPPVEVRIWEETDHLFIWNDFSLVKTALMDWTANLR